MNELVQLARELNDDPNVETAIIRGTGFETSVESPLLAVEPSNMEYGQAIPSALDRNDSIEFWGWRSGRLRFKPRA